MGGMLILVECEKGSYEKIIGGTLKAKAQSYYCPATDKIITRWVVIDKSGQRTELPQTSPKQDCPVKIKPIADDVCPGNRGKKVGTKVISHFD
jgi:hypothetical protein